jgi:glycosyltransferase involved in cell wall biosynthesis
METARGLHAAGHDVILYCKRESPLARWTLDAPFRVNREFDLEGFQPADAWKCLQSFRHTIRDFQPDILNPHCPPGHTYLALARGLSGSRARLIRTVADPRSPNRNPLNAFLHRHKTDGMIFTTRSSLNRYSGLLWKSTVPVQVILPGFRAEDFSNGVQRGDYRKRFGVAEDQIFAGIIARMSPEKGQEVFLEALSLLKPEQRKRFFCVMAGEDSRERGQDNLRALVKKYNLEDQIAFLGRLDDVRPLMAELDLGVITSVRSEAVCRVALEYMSLGIPIISSDVNILPEVVRDGQNGYVFHNRDAAAMARCLEAALDSPANRKARGETGYAMVRDEFLLSREIAVVVNFFERAQSRK